MKSSYHVLASGAILLGLAVGAGAFGAHALADLVTPERLQTFKTGVHYHLIHGIALMIVGILMDRVPRIRLSAWLFLIGTVLFSGSLYALVLADLPALGILTPFGGVAYILGWLLLAVRCLQAGRQE